MPRISPLSVTGHPHPLALTVATALSVGATSPGWAQTLNLPNVTPTPNTVGVARDSNVAMPFSASATLTFEQNFIVHGNQIARYPGTFTGNNSATVTFNPDASFKPGERIQLSYTGGDRVVWEFIAATTGGSGIFADSGQTLGTPATRSVVLGDVDGDSDLDLIEGNDGQANRVWLNNGLGTFSDSGQALGANNTRSVALGDVDGDSDLDLIEGNDGQANRVWLNDGSGVFTDSGQTLSSSNTTSVALGDVDGDSYLDVVVGNDGQANQVWLNNGLGTFSNSGQALGTNNTRSVALGDVDSDGNLDLIEGNDSQASRVWLNDGSGVFTDSGQTLGTQATYSVALGDVDNDNHLDVVLGNDGQANQVWLNNGLGTFSDSGQALGANNTRSVALGDVDGDSDLDLIEGNDGQANRVWLNDGSGVFTDSGQTLGAQATYSVALSDVDADNDLDLVEGNNNQANRVWLNQAPVDGACGAANNTPVIAAPTTNLCNTGTASSVSGTGPWLWTCVGSGGGTTANCSAPLSSGGGGVVPISGVCGSANGQVLTSPPNTGLCTLGSASAVIGTGPWDWTCTGSFGGSDASCSATLQTYNVIATAGSGGAISPATQVVGHGAIATVTITPETGYAITKVDGCNGSLSGNLYTTGPITAACTINAVFTITASATTTTLTSAPNPSLFGQVVTLTAMVHSTSAIPNGVVVFQEREMTIPGCANVTLSGGAASCTTAILPVGVQTLRAVYAGNATFIASTGTHTHKVNALTPVEVTTPGLPNAVVGLPYVATLDTSGGKPPYTYTATGLPAGLMLSAAGVLSGTPLVAGPATVVITATDAQGETDQRIYPLTVAAELTVATPYLINGIQGAAYGQILTAVGGSRPYTWDLLAGVLPDGLTLDSVSGLLSGIPATSGVQAFTVQVTDVDRQIAQQDLTLTIQTANFTRSDPVNPRLSPVTAALTLNPAAGPACTLNDQNTFTLNLGEHGVPVTGPAGLRFPHGLLQIEVAGCTPGDTQLMLTLVYPQTLPSGTQFWKYGLTPTNPTAHWYALSGVVISGNTVTYTIDDGGWGDDDLTANGVIIDPGGPAAPDFALTGELPVAGQVGEAYEGTLTAYNGIGPYAWGLAAGTLPNGLALLEVAPDDPTALLSGTPTRAGDFVFTFQVVDEGNDNRTAQQTFTVAIAPESPDACAWGLGPDTDGDGVPDAVEVTQGTDPHVKDNEVFTRPDAFVAQTYRDLLQREADANGLAYWQQQLQAGLTRGEFIDAFYQSSEFQQGVGAITRLYHAAFNRTPDACGLAYWVDQWQAGDPLEHIAAFFVVSGEFLDQGLTDPMDFVTRLYENVLDREPDADGLAYWLDQLEQGATWGEVLLGFTQSPEYRAALDSRVTADLYYLGFLDRDPDPAGYAFWVNDLDQTADSASVHEAVQAGTEYRYRVLGVSGVTRR
ncbi:MAG: VCBS repeat-containing protein [Candidatus Competibacteraceae bacterium]|nr:VCBS repeat-containing protein [Candidatus Competibacteraceae bacterium]